MKGFKNDISNELLNSSQFPLPKYIMIDKKNLTHESHLTFSPNLMQWSDNLLIIDLTTTSSFWRKKGSVMNLSPIGLIQSILNQLEIKRTVFSDNIWKGITLFYFMKSRDLEGTIDLNSSFGKKIYEQLNWFAWFKFIQSYGEHLQLIKRKGFNLKKFQKQCFTMRSTVKKLNLLSPWDLKEADENALQRRYGPVIADLWSQLFGRKTKICDLWIPWKPKPPIQIHRTLEYPLNKWDQLVPFIQQDLNQFFLMSNWISGLQIIKFNWIIYFEDHGDVLIPVEFRYPHDITTEKNHHKTSLFLFEKALLKTISEKNEIDNDLLTDSPALSWSFEITDWMVFPDQVLTIFGTEPSKEDWGLQLNKLENKLSVPLIEFSIKPDWIATNCYEVGGATCNRFEKHQFVWKQSAKSKPIFLFQTPEPLKFRGKLQFLERNMIKWWKQPYSNFHYLDFFKLTDRFQKSFWVAKDPEQNWWVHGIFG